MTEKEQEFIAQLADVLEVAALAPGDDYRKTHLWGSLTAFALKVTLQQKYGVSLTLKELDGFASVADLMGRVLA